MQTQAKQFSASEKTTLEFKRHILQQSHAFAEEPAADLYRIQLLGMMLNRYDELREKGMGEIAAENRTKYEFDDIADRMREQGFAEREMSDGFDAEEADPSRWPKMSEEEAIRYIHERDTYVHKMALGVLMCVACLTPMMLFTAVSELFWMAEEFFVMFGLVGLFVMIGMGVYTMVTAVKPKNEKRIKKKRFSLTRGLRSRLAQMREAIDEKARKRRGKGVALCVMSVIPVIIGAMMQEMFYVDAWTMLGIVGMFAMIAIGVYELVMADGEKTTMKRLLDGEKE